MKKFLRILLAFVFAIPMAVADTHHASLTLVRRPHHHKAQRHHAHRAARHKARRRYRSV